MRKKYIFEYLEIVYGEDNERLDVKHFIGHQI